MTATACTVNGCTKPARLTHDAYGDACPEHSYELDDWPPAWRVIPTPPPACQVPWCNDVARHAISGKWYCDSHHAIVAPYVDTPPADTNPRTQLLADAERLVNGDRNADYGDPNQDFARTAAMWGAYISGVAARKGINLPMDLLDTWDIAWMQVLLKASRSTTSPGKRDHYLDAAGYGACGWDCAKDVDGGEQ